MNPIIVKRKRILILLIVILIIGFTTTSVLSYLVSRNYVKNSAITQTLPLISDNIYSTIEADFMDPINVSSLMANDTFLINWITAGEKNIDDITDYLRRIKEKYGYDSAFYVSDMTGNYYTADGILKTISPQDSHDIWYFRFKGLNKSYDLDLDTDEASNGMMTVFINHRLETSSGEFLGVTGVGLQVANIGDRLRNYQKRFEHMIYLINSEGVIQIHPDEDLIENASITNMNGIRSISNEILATKNEVGIFEYTDSQGIKDISVRYIPEFDWFLIVEKDEGGSLATARNALFRNIIIGLVITGITSMLVVIIIRNYNQQLEQLATHDQLTGLLNRRTFNILLKQSLASAKRYRTPLSLLFIDVDDFKSINDQYGHSVGDEVLQKMATAMAFEMRQDDAIARWGGEEFIVMFPNTNHDQAKVVAKRIKAAAESIKVEGIRRQVVCTVSIGLTAYDGSSETIPDLLKQADEALYEAKVNGKDKITSFYEIKK